MYPRLLPPVLLACAFLVPSARAAAAEEPPNSPASQDAVKQQVRALVRDAGQLMDKGDRAGAVSRLQQAQHLRPDPSLDYNLGIVYAEWGKAPEAASAFARFLSGATADKVTRDRTEDARRRLDAYKEQLGRLMVVLPPDPAAPGAAVPIGPPAPGAPPASSSASSSASGASGTPAPQTGPPPPAVFIDNQFAGQAPFAHPAWLAPGAHNLRVSASSARDYAVSLTLTAGEERTVVAELTKVSMQAPPGATLVPPDLILQGVHEPVPLYKKWWFWTAVGGGVVVVAAVIGAGAAGKFNRPPPGTDLDPVDVAR